MLATIRVVLVETTHPGNIGATARAMKTMGLQQLRLVQPRRFPDPEATARASGADDLLAQAVVCDDLDQALADAHLILGASARLRTLEWPQLDGREAGEMAATAAAAGSVVALLFGRESSGLSNRELERCHYLVHIPTMPDFSSLNVAAAVQLLTYEVRMAALAAARSGAPADGSGSTPLPAAAPAAEMERFYHHLQQTLEELEFLDPAHPRQLMRRLRRLFGRAQPEATELNILRGMLTAAQQKARGIRYR